MSEITPLKWLVKRSKNQRWKMALLIIANAIFSVMSVLFAFCIREIIDSVTGETVKMNRFTLFAILICSIVIFQFIFRVVINGLSEHIRGKLEMEYRAHTFSKILTKKHDKITAYHSGELMNRLTSDVSVVADGVSTIVPTIVSAVARLISAIIALVLLDWVFAIAFSVAGVLVFAVVSVLRTKLKSLHKKAQETDGKTRSFMQECIENLLAVKVFSVNGKIERQAEELQKENFKVKMVRKNYSALGNATHNFIFSAGYLFALIYGGLRVIYVGLSYGSLSAILQLVNNVQVPFASLSTVLPKYYSMIASAERLMEIEDVEDEKINQFVDSKELYDKLDSISLENVVFSYGRDTVLKDASLVINKGDFVMIEGTSGVGKSTLIKLMLGVYPIDSGNISMNTTDGEIQLDGTTRTLFSYVPQGNMLFSGTLKDNVTFIKEDATEQEIERALRISCADEFINTLPQGLMTKVGESGVGLSEGQIQRIAIARAILCDAPIILLDEATSALDEQTEKNVLDNLKTIDGVTLIIVSHKKAASKICNRVIRVDKGKITEKV